MGGRRGRGRRRRARELTAEQSLPLDLELTDAAFGGEALGHLPDGRVIFVPRGLPGELVHVQPVEERRDFARGELLSVVRAAPRIASKPPCAHYAEGCGGCSWQHANYAAAAAAEAGHRGRAAATHRSLPRDADELVHPPLGMLDPWRYRNQARFTVGRRFGELCFTLRSTHRLLRIEHCWIVHPRIQEALEVAQGRLADVERRIHQISIRVGANTGQLLVSPALPEVPELESGQPYLEEELLGRRFRLQPPSFFQVNTRREVRPLPTQIHEARLHLPDDGLSMAELLALLVMDRLAAEPSDVVVDAYSGVGTFALLLAPLVREAIGIEEAQISCQRRRAQRGRRRQRALHPGQDRSRPAVAVSRPDAVVLDPARAGCHPDVLRALLETRPGRVVYVSCDPIPWRATCASWSTAATAARSPAAGHVSADVPHRVRGHPHALISGSG